MSRGRVYCLFGCRSPLLGGLGLLALALALGLVLNKGLQECNRTLGVQLDSHPGTPRCGVSVVCSHTVLLGPSAPDVQGVSLRTKIHPHTDTLHTSNATTEYVNFESKKTSRLYEMYNVILTL